MKGLVVVICAPSQGGKDFIASDTMQSLEKFYDAKTSYATCYKIREARADDAKHIHCIKDESLIPFPATNQITATVYDSQKLIYDKNEISEKINNGEIVFIATGSVELSEKIKQEFEKYSIIAFVKRQQVSKEIMLVEDLNRHGYKIPRIYSEKNISKYMVDNNYASKEDVASAEKRVINRLYWYEKIKPEYEKFVADKKHGADYIFKNWYTLIGGKWNKTIDEKAKDEFFSFRHFIYLVMKENNQTNSNWRENNYFDWFDNETRSKNIFTMQDEWIKYLESKKEKE